MSYDIAVFDPANAPRDDDAFVAWFQQQTAADDDPDAGTVALRNWFADFSGHFPAVNGPYADSDDGTTTYGFGRAVTRASCPDDEADKAARAGRSLAAKHGVGFYNANSGEERLFFPGGGSG
ncbi:hypothetical protein GCM10025789_08320 [Tessaracoccus lubricantis]|uniref:Uncharacterized protein n=1 Tax=Tessaracoccus lubricantis TaxID=545543 RepID=A0ABP9F5W9_9ACTN